MEEEKCISCNEPIEKEDMALCWDDEEEGKSGTIHLECAFKKSLRICTAEDCGYLTEEVDGNTECAECGEPTRKLTEKDKKRLSKAAKKVKEALKKLNKRKK